MKTKYFFLAALTGLALAGCSSDDFIADAPPVDSNEGMVPIMFNSLKSNFTRGENDFKGAEAAEKLNNMFVVAGYKGSQTTWTANDNSIVFDNYLVKYAPNTAHTTASNTDNWEYVGVNGSPIKHATDNGITQQTIKYWDYSKNQYDFFAWSTGKNHPVYVIGDLPTEATDVNDPDDAYYNTVYVTPITYTTATGSTGKAYTMSGSAEALSECYISDIVTVNKTGIEAGQYGEVSGYNQPVTLKFRQLGTKVRIGIYETVPGYSVKNVQFYSAAASDDASAAAAKIFTTEANQIYTKGTYQIFFPTVDAPNNADNNQAHITFKPNLDPDGTTDVDQATTIVWGALDYTIRESGESSDAEIYLGRTSNTASFAGDAAANYYMVYLPNQTGTNLNLRVNYTLESIDGSKELIVVKGATAQVPLIYTQWKPGYAYTYLFKISDKTNGYTGAYNPLYPDDTTVNSDPAGLYPITFDAVVVNAEEDATQETITTISTPSITTYQKGSKVVNQNEYDHATGPIFVTVNDGDISYELVTVTTGNPVAGYYTKSTEDVYTLASGTADGSTTYYTYDNGTGTYSAADPQPNLGDELTDLYTLSEKVTYTPAEGNAIANTEYYKMVTTVESGKLVTLTETGDNKAALYTLPTDKVYTEANVVDAMQMQDDDAKANTVKGRSGLVLTEAEFSLENTIEYGVDGNTIDLTALPNPAPATGTYSANAMKFSAAAAGTYAFVYTKKASTAETPKYQAKTFADGASVKGYYRYKLIAPTTPVANTHTGDVEKGVTYFDKNDASADAITAFLGQGVSNLYTLSGTEYTIASGYAETGTTYYYTTDGGQSYTAAVAVSYADFIATDSETTELTTPLYWYNPNKEGGAGYELRTETKPVDGRAYYANADGTGYCVIYPQRTYDGTTQLYVIDKTEANITKCGDNDKAVKGMTYFDKYTKNNGEYYVKVIKVE